MRIALLAMAVAVLFVFPAIGAEDEAPDVNKEAQAYAKGVKKGYKKMTSGDLMEAVDKMAAYYRNEAVDAKAARKALLDGFAKAATVKDSAVVAHTLKVLGTLDDNVLKILLPVMQRELKAKVPDENIYETALESLGKLHSANPSSTKALTDLLKHNDDIVVGRAARAIAGYAPAAGKIRKKLFEELLKASEGTYSSAQGSDERAKRKWNIIGDDIMTALMALSSPPRTSKMDNPPQMRSWYNANKKLSWEAPK